MQAPRDRGSLNPGPIVQREHFRPSRQLSHKPSVEDFFNPSKLQPLSGIHKSNTVGPSSRRGLFGGDVPYSEKRRSKLRPISSSNTFQWIKGDRIGKGSHGTVYLAFNATSGEIMAVKQVELPATPSDRMKPELEKFVEALRSERETLRDLDHENIVQYLGFEENQKTVNIFLQYISGGTIGGCLRNSGRFREDVTKSFSRQILQGLAYLHSNGILHRDMKSDNILVEETGVCKISDFGISKKLDNYDRAFSNMKGTSYWMAPEIFGLGSEKNGYDKKVDIWSLGCVVFEMWTAKRPWFEQFSILEVMINLLDTKIPPPLPEDLQLSMSAEHFRKECFQFDPEKRPTADLLLNHPYLSLPPEWTFPGMSNMSEPSLLSPATEELTEIAHTMRLENHDARFRRAASPALTMASGTLGSSSNSAPRVDAPRPITPPLVTIAPPPPRKPPIQDDSSVDWVVRGRSSSITSESSTSQRSSQQSAATKTRRLMIHNPDTIPDLTKSEKKRELPIPPGFVYNPPPLPEISGLVPYSQQLAPLPRTRFSPTPSLKQIKQDRDELNVVRAARTQEYASASTASLSAPMMPNRMGAANMQAIMAARSSNNDTETDSTDRDSNVTSSTWMVRPRRTPSSGLRPSSSRPSSTRPPSPTSPLEVVSPTQRRRGHKRVSSIAKDSRPNNQEVLKNLNVYFPNHNLDEPVVESPVEPKFSFNQSPNMDRLPAKSFVMKSIKAIAEEQIYRGLKSPDRRPQTRLWDSRTEEIAAPR